MEPKWHTLADYLIERFPELEADIEESYLSWTAAMSNPYPHFFLEEFLAPILLGEGLGIDPTARMRAGEILDDLLLSSDTDLASAALTSILEVLRDAPELRAKAWPFLGTTARSWMERLASS